MKIDPNIKNRSAYRDLMWGDADAGMTQPMMVIRAISKQSFVYWPFSNELLTSPRASTEVDL